MVIFEGKFQGPNKEAEETYIFRLTKRECQVIHGVLGEFHTIAKKSNKTYIHDDHYEVLEIGTAFARAMQKYPRELDNNRQTNLINTEDKQ